MVDKKTSNGRCRIVLTGGPGGGKTTAADLFRREIGERVVIVPEAATILFSGGFPRHRDEGAVRSLQTAIYHVQRNLEDVQSAHYSGRILICDRGTIDGAAYWPGDAVDFFKGVGTSMQDELDRYDAVIYFESAAVGGISIEGGNPERNETLEQAVYLDKKLRTLWQMHRRFVFVPHNKSFFRKMSEGLTAIVNVVNEVNHGSH